MSNKNEVMVVDEQMLQDTDAVRKAITNKHKKVSRLKTPKPFIKKKNGIGLCRIFLHERCRR